MIAPAEWLSPYRCDASDGLRYLISLRSAVRIWLSASGPPIRVEPRYTTRTSTEVRLTEDAPLVRQQEIHDAEELRAEDREADVRVGALESGGEPGAVDAACHGHDHACLLFLPAETEDGEAPGIHALRAGHAWEEEARHECRRDRQ